VALKGAARRRINKQQRCEGRGAEGRTLNEGKREKSKARSKHSQSKRRLGGGVMSNGIGNTRKGEKIKTKGERIREKKNTSRIK